MARRCSMCHHFLIVVAQYPSKATQKLRCPSGHFTTIVPLDPTERIGNRTNNKPKSEEHKDRFLAAQRRHMANLKAIRKPLPNATD